MLESEMPDDDDNFFAYNANLSGSLTKHPFNIINTRQ
jgi:hypothetical protein